MEVTGHMDRIVSEVEELKRVCDAFIEEHGPDGYAELLVGMLLLWVDTVEKGTGRELVEKLLKVVSEMKTVVPRIAEIDGELVLVN